jgi:hypothetical protein
LPSPPEHPPSFSSWPSVPSTLPAPQRTHGFFFKRMYLDSVFSHLAISPQHSLNDNVLWTCSFQCLIIATSNSTCLKIKGFSSPSLSKKQDIFCHKCLVNSTTTPS